MLFVIETSFSGGGPPRTAFLLDERGVDPPAAVAAAAEEASAAKASKSFWPCWVLLGAGRGGGVGERRPEPPSSPPPPPLGAEVKVDKAATAVSSFKFKLSLTRSDKLLAEKGNQIYFQNNSTVRTLSHGIKQVNPNPKRGKNFLKAPAYP